MHAAVLTGLAIIVGLLIYTLRMLGRKEDRQVADRMARRTRRQLEVLKPCPLCGTMLRRGERVHSIVFSGTGSSEAAGSGGQSRTSTALRIKESMAHLFGCPYCHPPSSDHPRICPVCARTIPAGGYVIARMFAKPGKKHVHVLGCTECRHRTT